MKLFDDTFKEKQQQAQAEYETKKAVAEQAKIDAKDAAAYAAQMAKEARQAKKEDREAAKAAAQIAKEQAVEAAKAAQTAEVEAAKSKPANPIVVKIVIAIAIITILTMIFGEMNSEPEEKIDPAVIAQEEAEKDLRWQQHKLTKHTSGDGITRGEIWISIDKFQTASYRARVLDYVKVTQSHPNGMDFVRVFLVPNAKFIGSGYVFGIATYCWPSKCRDMNLKPDYYDTKVSDQVLTPQQLKIAEEMVFFLDQNNKWPKEVLDKDGFPNHDKVITYVAKKLKITEQELNDNYIFPALNLWTGKRRY